MLKSYAGSGFILQIAKCKIFQDKVNFLGFQISREGILPVPDYVRAVQIIQYPKTKKQIKSLIGKFNYYRKHIHNLSGILQPLTDLLKGLDNDKKSTEKVGLTEPAKMAIDLIKKKLTEAPILAFPPWESKKP